MVLFLITIIIYKKQTNCTYNRMNSKLQTSTSFGNEDLEDRLNRMTAASNDISNVNGIRGVYRISSKMKGPNIVILGGVHGNESCGLYVLESLLRDFSNKKATLKKGTLTLVIGNLMACKKNQRQLSINLNRLFGNQETDTEEIELQRARELEPLLSSCDYLFDIHSFSSKGEAMIIAEKECLSLAEKLNVEHVVTPGIFFEEVFKGTTTAFAKRHGALSIALEAGQHDDPKTFSCSLNTTLSLLGYLDVLGEASVQTPRPHRIYELFHKEILSNINTQYMEQFKNMQRIERDTTIVESNGDQMQAPEDCFIVLPTAPDQLGNTKLNEEIFFLAREICSSSLENKGPLRNSRV